MHKDKKTILLTVSGRVDVGAIDQHFSLTIILTAILSISIPESTIQVVHLRLAKNDIEMFILFIFRPFTRHIVFNQANKLLFNNTL